MFEKNMNISFLLDFYGDVLNEKQRTILDLYYNDDLSLAEIAESEDLTRQGVRHVVKKAEEQLLFLENTLGLANHFMKIRSTDKSIISSLEAVCGLVREGAPKDEIVKRLEEQIVQIEALEQIGE